MRGAPHLWRLVAALVGAAGVMASVADAQVVVSQGFGGFNAPGADFAELFNKGATPVDLTGWSLQVSYNADTDPWEVVPLSGVIQPGQYYLIQLQGNDTSHTLPTPDLVHSGTSSTILFSDSGALALVNNTAQIPTGTCPAGLPQVMDFVHWDDLNVCFEGSGVAPETTSSQAAVRLDSGCQDTNNNAADFVATTPNPRNSAVNAFVAAAPSRVGYGTTATFTLAKSALACNPLGTVTSATIDLSALGGAVTAMFDDGLHGDGAAGDGVFGVQFAIGATQATGFYTLPVSLSDGTTTIATTHRAEVAAPAPAHDSCATAFGLNPVGTFPFFDSVDNSGANDGPSIACLTGTFQGYYDVWYTYTTGAAPKIIRMDVTGGQNVGIGVHTGSCGSLTRVGCTGANSRDHFLNANTTYYFQIVSDSATAPTAPLSIAMTLEDVPPAPANDTCAAATSLGDLETTFTATYDVRGATHDAPVSQTSTSCHAVFEGTGSFYATWFAFTPLGNGALTTTASGIDSTTTIFSGSCAGLTQIECSGSVTNTFSLTGGTTYYVQVSNYNPIPPTGNLSFEASFAAAPLNDVCSGATNLTGVLPTTFQQAPTNATADPGFACSTPDAPYGLWFQYTAAQDGAIVFSETGATNDVNWGVYGSCGSAELDCFFTDAGAAYALTAGQTVYLLAAHRTGFPSPPVAAHEFTFDFVPNSTNDDCADAFDLNAVSFPYAATFNNLGFDTELPGACFNGEARRAMWFRYTAPSSGRLYVDLPSTALLYHATYVASNPADPCNTLTEVACGDYGGDTTLRISVQAGVTYHIMIADGTTNGSPDPTVIPMVFSLNAPAGGNDTCAAATDISALPFTTLVADVLAYGDDPEPSCGLSGTARSGAWYTILPTRDMTLAVAESNSTANILAAVFTGCGGTEVACGTAETNTFQLTAGTRYHILIGVDSSSSLPANQPTNPYNYDLRFVELSPFTNDACADATTITGFPYRTAFNADVANPDVPSGVSATACNTSTAVVMQDTGWYTITPLTGGTLSGTIDGLGFRSVWAIYASPDGTCGSFTSTTAPLACGAESGTTSAGSSVNAFLAAGTTYYLQVGRHGTSGTAASGPLSLDLSFTGTVGGGCRPDFDGNGQVQVGDIFAFLSAWFAGTPASDFNQNTVVNEVADIFAFLSAWFAGCP